MSVTRSTRKVVPKMAAPTKRVGIGIRAERTRLFMVNAEKQLYYIRQLYSDTSGGNCRIKLYTVCSYVSYMHIS